MDIRRITDTAEISHVANDPRVLRWTVGDADINALPADWLKRSPMIRYGAFDDQGVVLYLAFSPLSAATWKSHVTVAPRCWGKGTESIAVDVLRHVTAENNLTAFFGAIPARHRAARRYVRHCGFSEVDTIAGGCRDGDLILCKLEVSEWKHW